MLHPQIVDDNAKDIAQRWGGADRSGVEHFREMRTSQLITKFALPTKKEKFFIRNLSISTFWELRGIVSVEVERARLDGQSADVIQKEKCLGFGDDRRGKERKACQLNRATSNT